MLRILMARLRWLLGGSCPTHTMLYSQLGMAGLDAPRQRELKRYEYKSDPDQEDWDFTLWEWELGGEG